VPNEAWRCPSSTLAPPRGGDSSMNARLGPHCRMERSAAGGLETYSTDSRPTKDHRFFAFEPGSCFTAPYCGALKPAISARAYGDCFPCPRTYSTSSLGRLDSEPIVNRTSDRPKPKLRSSLSAAASWARRSPSLRPRRRVCSSDLALDCEPAYYPPDTHARPANQGCRPRPRISRGPPRTGACLGRRSRY